MTNEPQGLAPEPGTSPLEEASPLSLEDIFNKDPLSLTDQDLDRTIAYFRDARETFLKEEETKVRKKATGRVAHSAATKVSDLKLDLGKLL